MISNYRPTALLVLAENTLETVYTDGSNYYISVVDGDFYGYELVPDSAILTKEEALDKYPEYMI